MTHGSDSTYTNHRCRCEECKAAHAVYSLGARARRAAALRKDPTLAKHGRLSTYSNWNCRCKACSRAHKTYRVGKGRAS